MKKTAFIFIMAFLLVGCEKETAVIQTDKDHVMTTAEENYNDLFLSLYYEDLYTPQRYEPQKGVYLGAYIMESGSIGADMIAFDDITKKPHTAYVYSMRVGDEFPYTWVLTCIKEGKIPHIVINPDDGYIMYDIEKVKNLSEKFGEVYVPMFVEFYPNPDIEAVTPHKYVEFYRASRLYFNENAPNVSMIFTTDVRNGNSFLYYPGDDYVDWVGITMAYPYYSKGKESNRDVIAEFERVYYTYQRKKPIMITGFMVSHFSTLDHGYKTGFALEKMDIVYNDILERYPRLKGIYYIDYDATRAEIPLYGAENFSVLEDMDILEYYRRAVGRDVFLTEIAKEDSEINETFKSPYDCLSRDGVIYIAEKSIRNDFFKNIDSSFIKGRIVIGNEYYYSCKDFREITGYSVYYNKTKNSVLAKKTDI